MHLAMQNNIKPPTKICLHTGVVVWSPCFWFLVFGLGARGGEHILMIGPQSRVKAATDLEGFLIKKKWDRGPLRRAQSYRGGAGHGRAQKTNGLKRKVVLGSSLITSKQLIWNRQVSKNKEDEEEEEEGGGEGRGGDSRL